MTLAEVREGARRREREGELSAGGLKLAIELAVLRTRSTGGHRVQRRVLVRPRDLGADLHLEALRSELEALDRHVARGRRSSRGRGRRCRRRGASPTARAENEDRDG